VVKIVSAERRDSAIVVPLVAACSVFRLQVPFECIDFFKSKQEIERLLSGVSFCSKQALLWCLKLEIALQSAVLLYSRTTQRKT
jgi:hypothetical protein